jgi:hypothetical protein
MRRSSFALPCLALVAISATAAAQTPRGQGQGYLFREPPATLTFFGGFAQPNAGSDLFDFSFDELTLGRRDLVAFDRGVDLAIRLSERTDLVLGLASSGRSQRSEFRDWVDNNDQPIEQTTRFRRTPLGATLRYHLVPRGRAISALSWIPAPVVPWVGAGGGVMWYRFQQAGDFIDFETSEIFFDRYTAEGWTPFAQGAAGAGWTIGPRLMLTTEARYVWGRGDLGSDFEGFERLDLSGVSTTLGLTIRF